MGNVIIKGFITMAKNKKHSLKAVETPALSRKEIIDRLEEIRSEVLENMASHVFLTVVTNKGTFTHLWKSDDEE